MHTLAEKEYIKIIQWHLWPLVLTTGTSEQTEKANIKMGQWGIEYQLILLWGNAFAMKMGGYIAIWLKDHCW